MTSFKSTAAFYGRYRVPYPASLLAHLTADAGLGHDSLVLDLATGPGRLALALAPSVGEVVAVDIEPAMLDEGRRLARGKGIANVKWVHERAEDVALVPGSVDLITMGEAFHRLEQDLVLRRCWQWLKDDACVALVGCFGVMHGERAWQEPLRRALSKWTHERPDPLTTPRGEVHDTRSLIEAGFDGVVNRAFTESHVWTREAILGHLHSTSRFSLSALGDEREDFERTVIGALGPEGSNRFLQDVSSGYTIGWKRGVGQAGAGDAPPVRRSQRHDASN